MVYKTTLKSLFAFLITFLFFVGFGFGQSIFDNPITGSDPSADNPYIINQYKNPNITVSGIGRGSGLITLATPPVNRYAARTWSTGSLDVNDFFEFKITPNSGYKIDFVSFVYTGQASSTGPINFAFRSSLDSYTANIGSPTATGTTIDLSGVDYQNISTSVTFRLYGWGGSSGQGSFSINDFTFNGVVSALPVCNSTPTTCSSGAWDNGEPDLATPAIINGDYHTGTNGSFSACSLTVNAGTTLTISDEDNGAPINTYVVVQTDVTVDGAIEMEPKASFVQLDDDGIVSVIGSIKVSKNTAPMNAWYEYTYWSSPVSGAQIGTALADSNANRRFLFNAKNYLDAKMETGNNNAQVDGQDDIDDDGNDWQRVNGTTVMQPGVGYAATHSEAAFVIPPGPFSPPQFRYTFDGPFNNGEIIVSVYRNDFEPNDNNWNLIGNPYPSAIDADLFLDTNSNIDININTPYTLDGAIFLWSQNTPPSSTANGNEQLNFSSSDYAIINGIGQTAGGDGLMPERKIPSGQAFFVSYSNAAIPLSITPNADGHDIAQGEVVFNNSMRVIGASDNAQFFKSSTSKSNPSSVANKLWINLTSDNGVFNQTLIGYVKGATNTDDGSYFDTRKNASTGTSAILYTTMDGSNKEFAIQGKAENSLNFSETINLGFKTSINTSTLYTLSMAQLQGEFLTNNTVYLKDNLLNKVHNLSDADYTFTSEVGEFNDRFVVMFNNQSLSTDELVADANTLKIIDLDNDRVTFSITNNLKIKNVTVFDLLGRELYQFKGQNSEETYLLSSLKNTIYIAKVELSNGATITKKAVKK
ncbi:T9SS type A sorting domain-containing protein [Confluentibacter flavum]|uniref:Secretion system C-terminal sorting domain-containing protein n=1 Tax=Confluentibacter flavum TaxID=1909700 RepID=A0A2N3HLP2_9FLAO|nr:T9SS type A sorting domain-containing protein [Confluentibacter flavum]PKQ45871.1 hypothetical protein CSW08_05445 [Confluentibacter flavum]